MVAIIIGTIYGLLFYAKVVKGGHGDESDELEGILLSFIIGFCTIILLMGVL